MTTETIKQSKEHLEYQFTKIESLQKENAELKKRIVEITDVLKTVEAVMKDSPFKDSVIRGFIQHALGLEIDLK